MKPTSLRLMMVRQLFAPGASGAPSVVSLASRRRGAGPLAIRSTRSGQPLRFAPRLRGPADTQANLEGGAL